MRKRNLLFILPTCIALASCKDNTGFIKVKNLTMISSDINNAYSPSKGNVKMLVVPITLNGDESSLGAWNTSKLETINNEYFGDKDSLKTYYDTASFGKMKITGMVTDVIDMTNWTHESINDDTSFNVLFNMLEELAGKIQAKYKDVNWNEYDLNNDGFFDNIHIITNYKATVWAEVLWPHMESIKRNRPESGLGINVYSINSILYISNKSSAIHEQGHIFGLEDYYDYSSKVDYLGGADMQSNNKFDWNSYSKMCMGWINPYVYTGKKNTAKITLKAASINGDCLIIPANYETWNGSPFDEYFLLELFSPLGNNKDDWRSWIGRLGKYGVRLYHVDSRIWGSNDFVHNGGNYPIVEDLTAQEINSKEDLGKWKYKCIGANNSYDYSDYESGIEQSKDFYQLGIIQASGENTFANPDTEYDLERFLESKDLFHEGDTFTFEKYSTFIDKTLLNRETLNNGETFPYSIHFDSMSEEEVTLTITKL